MNEQEYLKYVDDTRYADGPPMSREELASILLEIENERKNFLDKSCLER